MAEANEVGLDPAAPDEITLLSNLLELYIHDLSGAFPHVKLGADGRFGYEKLALFFTEPARRFPLVIKCDGQVAGFVLATRGSPASDDPDVLDVTEFFVIKRWRRLGVGRRAACLLWDRLPGRWIVRVSEQNAGAIPFWTGVIARYTGCPPAELAHPTHPDAWRVFSFHSRRQP